MKWLWPAISALLPFALAACGTPSAGSLQTPIPEEYLSTAIALTIAANSVPIQPSLEPSPFNPATVEATLFPTPTPLPEIPTEQPATEMPLPATPALAPVLNPPDALVQILAPGPLTKVISPIKLRLSVVPGYNDLVRVELFAEDGRLLVRQVQYIHSTHKWAYLVVEIPFEIRSIAELGRLQVSTEDKFGRTVTLGAVHILLQSEGLYELNPPGSLDERCVLLSPSPGGQVSGGTLVVQGHYRPYNDQPVVIELVTSSGQVVGSRMLSIQPTAEDGYIPFVTDIPYQVGDATWVRLTLRQSDARIPGPVYLFSQEVLLNP